MTIVLITAGFAFGLALVLGVLLGFFQEFFKVETDPLIAEIRGALPGVNCGVCGFPGCDGYAAAVASRSVEITKCAPGGISTVKTLSALLGVNASMNSMVVVLACQGSKDHAPNKAEYNGVETCRAAKLSTGGTKLCSWGCLGFGDCTLVCQFDALSMGDDGLPHVNFEKCTGCKKCISECPQQLFCEVPKDRQGPIVICTNRNPLKAMVRKTCKVGCIKCEICVKSCPEHCITMINGIPVVDYNICTRCGICIEKCPTKVFKMREENLTAV